MISLIALKLTFVFFCLLGAALSDWATLRVSDRLWKVMLPVGVVFFIIETTSFSDLITRLAIFNFCALVSYIFFWRGWWGGADTKGIMILALYFPYVWMLSLPVVYWIIVVSQVILTWVYRKDLPKYFFGGTISERPYFPSLLLGTILVVTFIYL